MEKMTRQLTPEQDALEHIIAGRDKPFLEERYIDPLKGRGVFTHKAIEPSTFVVEYRGNIFSHKNTKTEKKCGDSLNNFLFEFSWKGADWCVDASTEDQTLGRLVNDDHINPNCEMRTIVCEGKPHLCLFAVKEISPGEEITYNYGDSSCPWRSRLEESEAASSSDDGDDDDDVPDSGPSHETDSFANTSSQLDFRDNSPFTDLHSSQEMTGTLMPQPDDASCAQQEDEAAFSSDESCNEDYSPSKASRKPRDVSYTSKNYCYVCGGGFSKIARHLLRHADEEPDIAEAFALPKYSKERKALLENLRNRGNYKHNQEVVKNNSGELKLKRRDSSVTISTQTHVYCLYCKGLFKRYNVWKHVARCTARTKSDSTMEAKTAGRRRVLSEMVLVESPFSEKLPSDVWKMLVNMKQDETAFVVQNDFLLIQLAQYLSEKCRGNPNKHEYIRQKLREMGRLLIVLHKKSIYSFEDAIKPQNFYKVVESVKDVAGFDENVQGYKKPSLALKLGHSLKKIANIVLNGDDVNEQSIRDTKRFMKLCTKEWIDLVSHSALASLGGQKVNNPSTIPFTRDVQVFHRYLETASTSAIESLRKDQSPEAYMALCRVTLAQVSVLNKCAPEVSKMTLKAFQERDDTTQVLSKHFIRINILGRTGQNVAVLLTSELVSALTLLVSRRETCGVRQDNLFLFAKPNSSTSHYHGRNCIRAFSSLCRARNPEHLRSVHLHKHIARVFQILNLENDELSHLAKLLGHDIRADRDYYRLPEAAVELAKIAKLLLAMEKGSLERFKGNSLEEIEIEDELEPDVERGNTENGNAVEDNEESNHLPQQSDAVERQAVRETKRRKLTPEQDAVEHIKACKDKPFLEDMFIDDLKGRGVFTREAIEPSTFVVEFRGNLLSVKETRKKKCGDTLNNYMFDFSWKGENWRIDASKEDGTLGRLVNDDHISPNCKMKKIIFEGKLHLCLFAVKKISAGEEITYNYGDSTYSWRSAESGEERDTSQADLDAAPSSSEDESVEDSAGGSSSAESCSDDEYVPDDEPSSDDSSASNNSQQGQSFKSDPDSSKQRSSVQQPVDSSRFQQEGEADDSSDDDDDVPDGEPDDPSSSGKNYCYVCGKAQSKISRHLFIHRKEEADIAEAFALPLHCKERSRRLEVLRNRGNYKHNQKVLQTRCGELKVKRRKSNMSTSTFALCLYCKGMYSRTDMWRHMQKCSSNKSSKSAMRGRNKVLKLVAAAESTDRQDNSLDVSKLLKKLKKDEIASVVRNDSHILQMAQYLCHMNERKTNKYDTISHSLRLMGRLLLTLRKKSISSFEDAVKPQNFSKIVEAVGELAGFNEEMKSYSRPSLMRRLVYSLKKIGDLNFAKAMKDDADKQKIREAETFMKLCAKEWSCVPPSKLRNKAPTIEFTQDAQLLYHCLEKTAASAAESLTMYESSQVYNALLRATVTEVSILNYNKVEVSNVTLKSFNERDEAERHEDAAVCQSQFEQILSKRSVTINMRNNRGKKVAVTLTPKLLTAITLLVSKRESCGVHKINPFLFARPVDICTSVYHRHHCINTFAARCGAKNTANLRSVFFHKYVARVFQILSLTNDELDQLAKLLGRGIRTDSEYYRTPEAAGDIAKIAALLSAMEDGSLERFDGKSLEEIEIADELEPDVDQESPENSDAEEDNDESESPQQLSGSFTSRVSRSSSSRKRGRGRRRRQESEDEASEQSDEKNDEANTEKDDWPEETPVSYDVNTPEKTLSRSNEDAPKISFSDDDEDMNVDFDMDTDEDVPNARDVTKQGDDRSDTKKADSLPDKHTTVAGLEETVDIDGGGQNNSMDVDSRGSSAILNTEKKNKLSAAVTGMKDVKILIPKLDIEKLQSPIHISQLSSVCNSAERPLTDQPVRDDNRRHPASSTATDNKRKSSCAKTIEMICSRCKKSMIKGQTAYQKKGFTDVFCSKSCLFEMFRSNKPLTKTCHYCHKVISQPLDLIMAAVDMKGTMKDFCSVTCLSSFKSNKESTQTPQAVCGMCSKSCATTCQLTLNEAAHKFCSDSCLEDFRRENTATCENCSSTCHNKPLVLKLEEETKTFCSDKCLEEVKEVLRRAKKRKYEFFLRTCFKEANCNKF